MNRTPDVEPFRNGIALLREMCDPRGHALLDAIEGTLVELIVALDRLAAVQDGRPAVLADNDRWSRKAPPELRSVS